MSPEIVVALIGLVATVLAVVIPLMWRAHGRKLSDIKYQVENNHGTNLRDDLDFIRDVLLDVLRRVERLERK